MNFVVERSLTAKKVADLPRVVGELPDAPPLVSLALSESAVKGFENLAQRKGISYEQVVQDWLLAGLD